MCTYLFLHHSTMRFFFFFVGGRKSNWCSLKGISTSRVSYIGWFACLRVPSLSHIRTTNVSCTVSHTVSCAVSCAVSHTVSCAVSHTVSCASFRENCGPKHLTFYWEMIHQRIISSIFLLRKRYYIRVVQKQFFRVVWR